MDMVAMEDMEWMDAAGTVIQQADTVMAAGSAAASVLVLADLR